MFLKKIVVEAIKEGHQFNWRILSNWFWKVLAFKRPLMIDHGDLIHMADNYLKILIFLGQLWIKLWLWETIFKTVVKIVFETIILRGNISTIW